MTAPKPSDPITDRQPDKLGLSATQLIASCLAAMSATVVASFFGVAGTVIGAALGSMVAVVGNAVYGYSLRRTRSRVRQTLDVAVAHRFATEPARVIAQGEQAGTKPADGAPPAAGRQLGLLRPRRMALLAAGLCAVVLAATTAFEFASGQPLSATVTGKHGSGVSIGGGTSKKASPSPSQPAPTSSSGGGSSGTGSVRPTVTVTVTPSGSATQSSAPASSEPAGSPTGSASPTGSPAG